MAGKKTTQFPVRSTSFISTDVMDVSKHISSGPDVYESEQYLLGDLNDYLFAEYFLTKDTSSLLIDYTKTFKADTGTNQSIFNFNAFGGTALQILYKDTAGANFSRLRLHTDKWSVLGGDTAITGESHILTFTANSIQVSQDGVSGLDIATVQQMNTLVGAYLPIAGNTSGTPITGDIFINNHHKIGINNDKALFFGAYGSDQIWIHNGDSGTGRQSDLVLDYDLAMFAHTDSGGNSTVKCVSTSVILGSKNLSFFTVDDGIMTVESPVSGFAGIRYFSDYSANFDDRSLVDKGFTDDTYTQIISPANQYFTSGYGIDTTATGGSDVLNIGATNADVINIGSASTIVNILGYQLFEYAANQYVLDKCITLNYGGAVSSGVGVGFEIEENSLITGYFKTNAARNGFSIRPPASSYKADLNNDLLTADRAFSFPNVSGTFITTGGLSADWDAGDYQITYSHFKAKTSGGATLISSGGNDCFLFGAGGGANNTVYGALKLDYSTASRIMIIDASKNLIAADTATYPSLTEFAYVKGLGSKAVGISDSETLENKRITARTGTVSSSATPTINTDNVDFYSITALSAAITSMTTNLSGTPTDGQTLWIAITDNGTARGITWGASFESSLNSKLPTTTVVSTRMDVCFIWNTATSKWRCVGVS